MGNRTEGGSVGVRGDRPKGVEGKGIKTTSVRPEGETVLVQNGLDRGVWAQDDAVARERAGPQITNISPNSFSLAPNPPPALLSRLSTQAGPVLSTQKTTDFGVAWGRFAQDPQLWTLFPDKVSLPLSPPHLSLSLSLSRARARARSLALSLARALALCHARASSLALALSASLHLSVQQARALSPVVFFGKALGQRLISCLLKCVPRLLA